MRAESSSETERHGDPQIVGEGLARSLEHVRALARRDLPTLIIGATGTGKELLADAYAGVWLAERGAERTRFGKFNCTGFTDDLLRTELFGSKKGAYTGAVDRDGVVAHHSLICLDELGDAGESIQAQLLRLVEYGTYLPVGASREESFDGRFIASTNRPDGIRPDLSARFHIVEIPLLAERPGDLAALVRHFGQEMAIERVTLRFAVWAALYLWPGNVRELRRACEEGSLTGTLDIPRHALTRFDVRTVDAMQAKGVSWSDATTMFALSEFAVRFTQLVDLPEMRRRIRQHQWQASRAKPDIAASLARIADRMESIAHYAESKRFDSSFQGYQLASRIPDAAPTRKDSERSTLEAELQAAGSVTALAEKLGVPRNTLAGRLRRIGIDVSKFRKRRR
jgi:DNA-binding NtrC family response regulator